MRVLFALALVGVLAAAIGWTLSAPVTVNEQEVASWAAGDAARGERIYWAGGCASCHAAPLAPGAEKPENHKLVMTGGYRFETDFGTFIAPNISSDATHGIGGWSLAQFASAMLHGTAPDGSHYYPAFPYTSYTRMKEGDVADLYAFMKTLPASDVPSVPHEVGFPFNIRRGLGLWKLLYLDDGPAQAVDTSDAQVAEGQYLVEALAHCGACHTPRNAIGGPDLARWMAGGPNPDGKGSIPNISPHPDGIADWSAADIAESLSSGFTPEFDSFGGSMTSVQENMARLSGEDRAAIAAYLKAIKPVPDAPEAQTAR